MKITVENLKLNRNEISFVKPPCVCSECADKNGDCIQLLIKGKDELYSALVNILEEFDCSKCLGVAFKMDGEVILACKEEQQFRRATKETCLDSLHEIVDYFEIHHMLIIEEEEEEEEEDLFRVIY